MKSYTVIRGAMFFHWVRGRSSYSVVLLLAALANPLASQAQAGFVDPSFLNGMTGPNSWLWAGALQPDGKLLLGGQFTSFNGCHAVPWLA